MAVMPVLGFGQAMRVVEEKEEETKFLSRKRRMHDTRSLIRPTGRNIHLPNPLRAPGWTIGKPI